MAGGGEGAREASAWARLGGLFEAHISDEQQTKRPILENI